MPDPITFTSVAIFLYQLYKRLRVNPRFHRLT
jgi:hypothetical protein